MTEARSFASLTGSLLARKGGARPAMRPHTLTSPQMLDDLGWDDMGDAADVHEHVPSSIAALTPAPKPVAPAEEEVPVHAQQRVLADHFGPAESAEPTALPEAVVTALRSPVGKRRRGRKDSTPGKKAAFTLRLDAERHLRLRLASALTGRSSQQLVTSALDSFLETLPEVGSLARQLPTRSGTGN